MQIINDQECKNFLQDLNLKTFDDILKFKNDFCYKRNRYRAVYKMVCDGRRNIFLKIYDGISLTMLLNLIFVLKRSEARKEFDNMHLLKTLGISTLTPLGYGEKKIFGLPVKSFLLTESLEKLPRLEDVAAKLWSKISFKVKYKIINNLVNIVFTLHSNNLFHKDLYLGHILYEERKDVQDPLLYLIDLQRIKKHNIRLKRWRIKDLSSLNYSADLCGIENKCRLRFLKSYCAKMEVSYKDYIVPIYKKTERIKKHTMKHFLKKNIRKKQRKI